MKLRSLTDHTANHLSGGSVLCRASEAHLPEDERRGVFAVGDAVVIDRLADSGTVEHTTTWSRWDLCRAIIGLWPVAACGIAGMALLDWLCPDRWLPVAAPVALVAYVDGLWWRLRA
jgi:hypothetical protein